MKHVCWSTCMMHASCKGREGFKKEILLFKRGFGFSNWCLIDFNVVVNSREFMERS